MLTIVFFPFRQRFDRLQVNTTYYLQTITHSIAFQSEIATTSYSTDEGKFILFSSTDIYTQKCSYLMVE